jgi:hypothetical protein
MSLLFHSHNQSLTGRKDEVEMLKEELVRKDRLLELTERKLKVLDGAYADMSEKYVVPLSCAPRWVTCVLISFLHLVCCLVGCCRYFVSVAVFAKMNATTEGYYCNIDVHQLYAEAQRLQVEALLYFVGNCAQAAVLPVCPCVQIDPPEWPQWITLEIQKNATRMRG